MSETWFRKRRGFFLSFSLSDTPHYENVPFEVPESWVWCRLEDIVCELKYGTSEKSSSVGKIAVLRMGNITNVGTIDYSNLVYSSNDADIEQYSLEKDDLLFNRTNSSEWVGKTAIYKEEQPAIYAGYLIRIRPLLISPDYLNTVMNSGYYRDWCYDVKTDAVNQSNINAQKLSQLMIPIPPLKEQGRIVAEMDKWISLIDIIKNGKGDLLIVTKQAKSKILDLAIHGKLIPQDPNDEPAIELLKRINPSFTPCDNGHSEKLPQGWSITELTNLADIKNGYAFKSSNYISSNGVRLIRIANVQDGYIEDKMPQFYPFDKMKALKDFMLTEGDILMSLTGNVGRVGILTNELLPAALNQRVACIKEHPNIIAKKFLFYTFQTSNFSKDCVKSGKGVAQLNISTEWLKHYFILIPPLTEQQRIVQKIEELFSVLDNIQNALEV